jgi:serine/threonine protein kinase
VTLIGQHIRGYEFLKPIGAGGFGMVYEAIETAVNRRVAIKIILPEHASKPDFIANFEAEAKLVAQLEHINIVPLYTYWQDAQGAFLVMRYIQGGSLRQMIAQQGALPLAQTTRIIGQIAEALHTAHEKSVIHRDLKPDNILIDERGNAYLTDFGIAKQLDKHQSAADDIKGTLAYLSPEQIQGQPVSAQTDIYALGVVLYEMLTGKHPFQDVPVTMMVMKHLQEALPDVSARRPDLPRELDELIEKATAKNPIERYTSTLEVAADLKRMGESSSATPVLQSVAARTLTHKLPASPEQRNRYAMLQNVRKFWIEGVLDNSLHDAARLELGMKPEADAVDNPWDTLLRTPGGDERLPASTHIIDIFERMNGKLLILGDPGSGKTTTLLELARALLDRAEVDDAHPIPIVFNLSSWGEKQSPLNDWLAEELSSKYQVPRKVATQWVADEEVLLLLDGLDEVTENARDACVAAINAYRGEHGFVDVVVCSRVKDYEALANHLKLNGAIVIQPLDDAQIGKYLDALGADVAVVRELINRDEQLRELVQSPLMLSIMILAYRGKSAEDMPVFEDVEAQRKHLFEIYVQRMFNRRIGEKPYTQAETRHYLAWLAQKMRQHGQSLFQIEELQPTWLSTSQLTAAFPRSVRWLTTLWMALCLFAAGLFWFFAAAGVSPLVIAGYGITGVIYGYLFAHDFVLGDNRTTHNFTSVLIGALLGLSMCIAASSIQHLYIAIIFGVLYGSAMSITSVSFHLRWVKRFRTSSTVIVPLERIQFSFRSIEWIRLILAMIFQLTAAIMFGFALFPAHISLDAPKVIIVLALGTIMIFGFNVYMDGFTAADVQMRLQPNEGMFSTLRIIVQFTIAAAIFVAAIPLGLLVLGINAVSALLVWFATAVHHGGDTVLSHGGIPLMQHLLLRYQLRRENAIPANLARFLDYAASLILLRKVGGGYIFVHRYLLEYFAALDTAPAKRIEGK